MGDFIYDLLQDMHNYTNRFIDTMFDFCFYPIINKPTRITEQSRSCIDHIWTNVHDKSIKSAIITHLISDHLPVIQSTIISNDYKCKENPKTCKTRNFSKPNQALFYESLSAISPNSILHGSSADEAMDKFICKYTNLLNAHFLLVKNRKSTSNNIWFTNELQKLMNKKDRLYKKYIKDNTLTNKQNYNAARNMYFRKVTFEI